MDLPPSYEEAIKQAPIPLDTSSGGNFYRQVLMQKMSKCICVGNILVVREWKSSSPKLRCSSQVSRKAPDSVRNLVRQVTVHLVGEEEATEQKIDQNILLFLIYIIIIILVALISLFVAIFTAPLFLNGWINIDSQ